MKIAHLIAGTVVALGMAVSAAPSEAAQLTPHVTYQNQSLAQQVYHRRWHGPRWHGFYGYRVHNSCRYWRHECAERWGWGSRQFYRCVWRHGC